MRGAVSLWCGSPGGRGALPAAWNSTPASWDVRCIQDWDNPATHTSCSFIGSIRSLLVAVIRRPSIPWRGFFQWDLLEQQLAQLANDAHLLTELFHSAKFERERLFEHPA